MLKSLKSLLFCVYDKIKILFERFLIVRWLGVCLFLYDSVCLIILIYILNKKSKIKSVWINWLIDWLLVLGIIDYFI